MLLDKTVPKSKPNRKTNKRKPASSIHPYVETIQTKLNSTQEDYNKLEEDENTRELTTEELAQKQKLKITMETYEGLLTEYNTSSSIKSKLRSFQDREAADVRQRTEAQIIELLNLFYLVRVGSLGTFDPIDFPNKESLLRAAMDACDQMVGASIYCKVYHSAQVRLRKKEHISTTLKKLEIGSEEIILEGISFKQIKDFMQHIWNYATCAQEEEEEETNGKREEGVEESHQVSESAKVPVQQTPSEQDELEQTPQQEVEEKPKQEEVTKEEAQEEKVEEGWGEPPASVEQDAWTSQQEETKRGEAEEEQEASSSGWGQIESSPTQESNQDWNRTSQDYADTNNDWRRRDSTDMYNKRGRGNSNTRSRGTRSRGRGRGSSRGHGTTLSRGGSNRGRGRGRGGRDEMTDTI